MLAFVGMDPHADISWVEGESLDETMNLFINGNADAFLGLAPQSYQVRASKVGHVVVDTASDHPWVPVFLLSCRCALRIRKAQSGRD